MGLFKPKPRKFETGKLIVTDEIVNMMEDENFRVFVYASYIRYCANDWGDIERCDQKINRQNLKHKGNLGGRYVNDENGWEIWILTTGSGDRTIISLPNQGISAADVEEKRKEAENE